MAFDPVDRKLDSLCRRSELTYSRYVDDIAISGDRDLRPFRGAVIEAIAVAGFEVAPEKTRFMGRGEQQVVTNLIVNEKLRPKKAFFSRVDEDVWFCLRAGPAALAALEGLTVGAVKARLTGQVSYIAQADAALGRKLRGRLFGINWKSPVATAEQR